MPKAILPMFVADSSPPESNLRPPKALCLKKKTVPALTDYVFLKVSVLKKALSILPKKERGIELLHFNYLTDAHSSDTVIIRYSFKNALWYLLDNKPTIESRHVLVCPSGNDKEVHLTVQGLFRKNSYVIVLEQGHARLNEMGQN